MPQAPQPGSVRRLVVVVSDGEVVGPAASRALADLAGGRPVCAAVPAARHPVNGEYAEIIRRGRRFLDPAVPADAFILVAADSLAAVPDTVSRAAQGQRAVLTLLVLDHRDCRYVAASPGHLNGELAKLALSLRDCAEFEPGPHTVQVYTTPDPAYRYCAEHFTPRWMPEQAWVVTADVACAFVDSVQLHCSARSRRTPKPSTLANAIAGFLTAQAGADWGLHYFTGSGVAKFIDDIECRAVRGGNPVVRGPSEHSLACSALARWTLDGAPFAIVVTSGMHDEFRGTLAGHVAARSKGFIVCADSRPDQWHPFQGTIHSTQDSRASLRARGFPVVYIGWSKEIGRGLAEAFAAYSAGQGPVMVIAPPAVLQASVALGELPRVPGQGTNAAEPAAGQEAVQVARQGTAQAAGQPAPIAVTQGTARAGTVRCDGLAQLATLLNSGPPRFLCQAGALSGGGRELLYALARKAGIGLADSLTQPGTVSRYHRGRVVAEYLGTLSMYGYSARVHEYLFSGGALRPAAEQPVMFLGTQIPEIDTLFPASTLRQLAPVQVTAREIDRAPFCGLSVIGDTEDVLRALHERLDVAPGVLERRRAAIAATSDSGGDVIGLLPVLPMTTNYFFRRLREVLDGLIRREGYRYTGVYDVGRAGLSAVTSLPRTGPGVSGWFGRALMGDGLMALPGILTRRPANVICFAGDGAAALTPDIVPTLVQQITAGHSAFEGNLSIFRFVNGSLSIIRTYREGGQPSAVSGQTGVLSITPEDYQHHYGSLTVRHRRVAGFDDVPFAHQLTERKTINLYSVITGHNNEGDGLGRTAALSWQRDELSPRALTAAGAYPPPQ